MTLSSSFLILNDGISSSFQISTSVVAILLFHPLVAVHHCQMFALAINFTAASKILKSWSLRGFTPGLSPGLDPPFPLNPTSPPPGPYAFGLHALRSRCRLKFTRTPHTFSSPITLNQRFAPLTCLMYWIFSFHFPFSDWNIL